MNFRLLPTVQNKVYLILLVVCSLFSTVAYATTVEQQTHAYLQALRSIQATGDTKTVEGYNKTMDEAWQFFTKHQSVVLPILRRELRAELKKAEPNNLFLLDIGYFIRRDPVQSDKEIGKAALLRIDPNAKIVQWNQQELFMFAYAVVEDKDPRILTFLDKAFLQGKVKAFVPQHMLTLDETLVCVFLYGKYGPLAEAHLREQLTNPALAQRIIEILNWLGTPGSVPQVQQAMLTNPDYETFIRGTAFMMTAGGPSGRKAMLALNPKKYDAKAQKYYAEIHKQIESAGYETLRKPFDTGNATAHLNDEEVKQRLTAMYANYGKDESTQPEAILDATLPREYLINELVKIRGRMFYRLSDEGLSDVRVTNAVLNALYYRPQ